MSRDYADPKCPKCGGTGFIYPDCIYTRPGEKGGEYCDCTKDALKLVNMESIWKSLSEAKDIPGLRNDPPLKLFLRRNLWITTSEITFRRHMKALAYAMSSMWDCRVYADSQLLDSWFGTQKAQGIKIYDLEIERATLEAIDLPDLVTPPDLLVIFLGVKQLPNKEAPNALLEALGLRRYEGKPTWIVDQPDHRINEVHHRFYSESLESLLSTWSHIRIINDKVKNFKSVSTVVDVVAQDGAITAALEDLDAPRESAPAEEPAEGITDDADDEGEDAVDDAGGIIDELAEEDESNNHTTSFLHTLSLEDPKPRKPRGRGGRR